MERRTAIVELTAQELTLALQSVLPAATLTSHALATTGRANTNYLLHTSHGRMVLRLHARAAALGAKERKIVELVAGQVPIAPILGHGENSSGHAFTLLSFVDGDTLEQVLLGANPTRIERAARALGRSLARLASHHFDHPGDLVPAAADGVAVQPWPFSDFFRWALFESPAGPRLGQTRDRLWAFLQDARARYPDSWHTHLVHGDFNPTNLLIDEQGELAAVLDWEFAHAGSIWMDLGNLLRHRPETPLPDSFAALVLEGLQDAGVTLPTHWRTLSLLTDLASACDFLSTADDRPQTHARALQQIHDTLAQLDG